MSGRILIVTRDPETGAHLRAPLMEGGYEVHVAESEVRALDYLLTQVFHVVLLDCDGLASPPLSVLESMRRRWPDLAVILAVSTSQLFDTHQLWEMPNTASLVKPLDKAFLLDVIREMSASKLHVSRHESGTVLVLDDDPDMRDMLCHELPQLGFEVAAVHDGDAALELLRRRKFDLVLYDLEPQGTGAIETLEALKATDSSLEVVIGTEYATLDVAQACIKRGAYDYLSKPFNLGDLGLLLERALERGRLQSILGLYEASRPLLMTKDRSDLIDLAVAQGGKCVSNSAVALVLERGDGFEFHRLPGSESPSDSLLLELTQRCLRLDRPCRFVSGKLPVGDPNVFSLSLLASSVDNAMALPLTVRGNSLGAFIMVRERDMTGFGNSDLQRAMVFAMQIALALDNLRLYEGLSTAEQLARASEGHLKAVIDAAYSGIILLDSDLVIREVNPAAVRMFALPCQELIGQPFTSWLSESDRAAFEGMAEEQKRPSLFKPLKVMALRAGGEEFPCDLNIAQLGARGDGAFVAFIRDLSETQRLEVELRHAQKLEAVGRLAAGIAHEINTPIQFVGDNASFLRTAFESLVGVIRAYQQAYGPLQGSEGTDDLDDLDYFMTQVPTSLEWIREGVSRVASIVQAMKEFAHPDSTEKTLSDLNRAILSALTIAKNELKYVADVETHLGEIPLIMYHVGDFNQVLLNLLVNAAHAIEGAVKGTGKKGLITVETAVEDEMVLVLIGDSGTGIPAAIQEKIFDPFFTTKDVGKGTGQGLAIARSIVVDRHGGSLSFKTEEGVGTTFYIRLPINGQPREKVADR